MPLTPVEVAPEAALASLQAVGPYTVVWLNEAQHYLLTADPDLGREVAAGRLGLLRSPGRGPVPVLGTLWRNYWGILTAAPDPGKPDPHARARELLKNASIPLPETSLPSLGRSVIHRRREDLTAELHRKATLHAR